MVVGYRSDMDVSSLLCDAAVSGSWNTGLIWLRVLVCLKCGSTSQAVPPMVRMHQGSPCTVEAAWWWPPGTMGWGSAFVSKPGFGLGQGEEINEISACGTRCRAGGGYRRRWLIAGWVSVCVLGICLFLSVLY